MDLGTIIGIVAGLVCVAYPLTMGDPLAFIDIPSMVIVVGGMISATLMHFSMAQFKSIFPVIRKTVFCKLPTNSEIIQKMVNYSAINRRDGSLALEKQINDAGDKFFIKGLRMVVDGQSEEMIEKQLGLEIDNLVERHGTGKKIVEFMGASAPAFGMLGTLIGLVQMLGNMEDPSQIGTGMAVALITTFYGSVIANLICIPLAGKLGMRSKDEALMRSMIIEGILGIAAGEAPTAVKDRMQTFLATSKRFNIKPKI